MMSNKKYVQISEVFSPDLIKESKELTKHVIKGDGMPPVFVKLLEEPFENWVICFEDIRFNENNVPQFGYNIMRVPKDVNDIMIESNRSRLNSLLVEVFYDIVVNTEEHIEQIPTTAK